MRQPTFPDATGSRRDTRSLLFDFIHAQRQTSRTRLARALNLSKATVSSGVGELLEQGLVREVGKHQLRQGRGRSQVLIEVEPRSRLVLGAQIGDEACTVVLTDLYAQLEEKAVVPVRGTAPDDAVAAIVRGVTELRRRADVPLIGLGVGAPGVVDGTGRRVMVSLGHHWHEVPLAELLTRRLELPVRVANRAKVAALGEHWSRMGQGVEDLVYVHVGTGIVAGLVLNGSLYFGRNGLAGELGHVTIVPDGPPCDCGNRGCLQTLASTPAILHQVRARARTPESLRLVQAVNGSAESGGLELVVRAARTGDALAVAVLEEAGTYLGIAIANLVNMFNPQVIVLGGVVGRLSDFVLEPIQREVRRRALRDALVELNIVPSAFPGEEAGAIGAAALFLNQLPAMMPDAGEADVDNDDGEAGTAPGLVDEQAVPAGIG